MEEGNGQQQEAVEPGTPMLFGDYEVLKSIGKGKFAIVYRATKIGDNQVVALKRIAVDMMNEKAREKCLKEVRLLQSLDHPNIIRYMDSFITENDLVIVYEWAAAGDLKRQLRKAQERGTGFEERVIWKYFSQICNAIKHMHDRRIMHRDLKPANIFLTLDGTIKVGDLGLSRELSEHTIQAHSKVGTPLYMSPEVLKGEGYDFKSDIWSLGCLLYELAMLKSPFKSEGLNLYSLFQKISNGDYQPLPENYSEELRKLTYAMISTLPEDRPEINYVCKVAQEMRTLTAEKGSKSRKGSAAAAREESSRPGSGLVSRPQTEGGGAKEGDLDDAAEVGVGTGSREGHVRASASTAGAGLVREGSFKLERVNSEWDGGDGNGVPVSASGGRDGARRGKSPPSRSRTRSGGGGNPRDASFDQQDEGEDEATVGLGQAPYLEDRSRGVAVLGSDGSPGRNKARPAVLQEAGRAEQKEPSEKVERRAQSKNEIAPEPIASQRRIEAQELQRPSSEDHHSQTAAQRATVAPAAAANPYRRTKEAAPTSADRSSSSREGRDRGPQRAEGSLTRGTSASKQRPESATFALQGDRREGEGRLVNGKSVEQQLEGSAPAFAVMEVLYSKLQLAGYPMEDPYVKAEYRSRDRASRGRLLPVHFACDLQVLGQVAGHDAAHPFMQFRRCAHVAMWLCAAIGGEAAAAVGRIEVDQDAPVTVAKQLLRATQAACPDRSQFPPELSEVSPTSLTLGFGLNVCNLLLFLADRALQEKGFVPGPLGHSNGAAGGQAGADDGTFNVAEDGGSDLEDQAEAGRSDDEGAGRGTAADPSEASQSLEDSALSARGAGGSRHILSASMVIGAIDPLLWKAETERVATKLAAGLGRGALLGLGQLSAEWADHVEALRRYRDLHSSTSSGAVSGGGDVPRLRREASEGNADVHAVVAALLQKKADLQGNLGRIRSLEGTLQRTGSVPVSALSFSSLKEELSTKERAIAELQSKISQCSAQLAALQDSCEEASEALRSKSGGGAAEGSEGSGAVARLKQGLFTINAEIKAMSTSVALLNNRLLAERKAESAAGHARRREATSRRGKGGKGTRNEPDGDVFTD